ncbi:MAG: carboxypeptidase-like regulatory domain-containing protein [Bacteroidota bacterium]
MKPLIFICLLCMCSVMMGQTDDLIPLDSLRIQGRVVGPNQTPLAYVTVLVWVGEKFIVGARTDETGLFSISFPLVQANAPTIIDFRYLAQSKRFPIREFIGPKRRKEVVFWPVPCSIQVEWVEDIESDNAYRRMFFPKN